MMKAQNEMSLESCRENAKNHMRSSRKPANAYSSSRWLRRRVLLKKLVRDLVLRRLGLRVRVLCASPRANDRAQRGQIISPSAGTSARVGTSSAGGGFASLQETHLHGSHPHHLGRLCRHDATASRPTGRHRALRYHEPGLCTASWGLNHKKDSALCVAQIP